MKIDQLIRSKRKGIKLTVMTNGTLVVRAQCHYSQMHIQQFVDENAEWILKKQAWVKGYYPQVPARKYIPGEKFLYLGKLYELSITQNNHVPFTFDSTHFILTEHSRQNADELFRKWYKQEALKVMSERAIYYSSLLKVEFTKIRITSAKHRWGSCNEKKHIHFPFYLVMAPLPVIDSIVIHELFHTIEMGHSPEFRKIVRLVSPHYDEHMNWLRKYQNLFTL